MTFDLSNLFIAHGSPFRNVATALENYLGARSSERVNRAKERKKLMPDDSRVSRCSDVEINENRSLVIALRYRTTSCLDDRETAPCYTGEKCAINPRLVG